jgi:phosphatidylserine/phosphatidylglycerophosphate/cardiolipin synthase-like enzyme
MHFMTGLTLGACVPSWPGLRHVCTSDSVLDDAKRSGIDDSAALGLHARTFPLDRSRILVGSFNLDPPSDRLNTEMGIVIASPDLAGGLATNFRSVFRAMRSKRASPLTAVASNGSNRHPPVKSTMRPNRQPAPQGARGTTIWRHFRSNGCYNGGLANESIALDPRAGHPLTRRQGALVHD